MIYPNYEDGVLCRYIGTNYGVRTIEGNNGRVYAGGQAAPRQRIHRDDLELLKGSFKPLFKTPVAEVAHVEAEPVKAKK